MNKRGFILTLFAVAAALTGWIVYITAQTRQPTPIENISVDWWGSAHANVKAEAFAHWNEDEPPVVPVNCAKCHSGQAFLDYLGQDGSTAFKVDEPGVIESVVSCEVCHNPAADALTVAKFPSGVELAFTGSDALCATCHSGLTAGSRVDTNAKDIPDDHVMPEAGLVAPHYAFAAATLMGSDAKVGYEYSGQTYVGRFEHAAGVQTCTDCHDPHTLRMQVDPLTEKSQLCATCHSNVTSFSDYRAVTVDGIDYDGDGKAEGIFHEIEGAQEVLVKSMQTYASKNLGKPLGFELGQFPYVFNDTNGDGTLSVDEKAFANAFKSFTPRLQRAAFNYMFSVKDPAGYVHNGKYVLQLIFDAVADLRSVTGESGAILIRPVAD